MCIAEDWEKDLRHVRQMLSPAPLISAAPFYQFKAVTQINKPEFKDTTGH